MNLVVAHVLLGVLRLEVALQLVGRSEKFAGTLEGLGVLIKRRGSLRPLARDLAVHRQTTPLAHGRWLVGLACLQQLDCGLFRKALIVVIVKLHHGRIGAAAQALHLQEEELAVGGAGALLNTKVILVVRPEFKGRVGGS